MKLAGSPAGISTTRGGGVNTSERLIALGQNYSLAAPTAQYLSKGNRCGHNKNDPHFYSAPENINKFPKIIQRAQNVLELSYFDLKKFWKSLNFLEGKQKRSERRHACAIVGQFLNIHNDLKNFTVKFPARDIAHYTKLSLSRVKQALRDLTRAGYIRTNEFIKHCFKGAWYGITAIRELTDKFYLELGISEHALHSARCWKSGNKMQDTRDNKPQGIIMKKLGEFFGKSQSAPYSAVNSKPFYQSDEPPIYTQSLPDLVKTQTPPEEITNDLITKAKEESAITKEPWFKIYRRLEKEYKSSSSPPST